MKKEVLQTINRHNMLEKGTHVVIGLSGGPDSVCLFNVMRQLSHEKELTLYAVHINHGLRPVAADMDELYVRQICSEAGISCSVHKIDCLAKARDEGITSEEAGRKARYEAFNREAQRIHDQLGIDREKIVIALAHNAEDQAETILFRIMRGTGTDGLSGIPYVRKDEGGYRIIRPLLDIRRNMIESYCRQEGLMPRTDHTNSENIYTRNKIRNMLIPYIKENFNENIIETVNRLGKVAAEDRDYFEREAEKEFAFSLVDDSDKKMSVKTYDRIVTLKTKYLRTLHRAVRIRVYTKALRTVGITDNITYAQMEGIDRVLQSESPSAMYNLSDGTKVFREYDRLNFVSGRNISAGIEDCSILSSDMTVKGKSVDGWSLYETTRKEAEEIQRKSHWQVGVFSGVTLDQLAIRTREKGDIIRLKGGTKKIQDFFTDKKVPRAYRDKLLLLAKGSEILWVLPSEFFPEEPLKSKGRFSVLYRVEPDREQSTQCAEDNVIILEKL